MHYLFDQILKSLITDDNINISLLCDIQKA